VFAKLLVAAVVVAAVGAVLWASGAVAPGGDSGADRASRRAEPIPTETWARRVGAICRWERQESKGLLRRLRTTYTYRDAELWVRAASRVADRSIAMFRRLPPPQDHRRQHADVLRLLARQEAAGKAMAKAVHEHDDRAFFREAERVFRLSERVNRILVRLGVEGCSPIPKEELPSERRLSV
jgi:hypothetical protein